MPKFDYRWEVMRKAVEVAHGGMSVKQAARQFKVARSTLKGKIKQRYSTPEQKRMGIVPYLPPEEEGSIVQGIEKLGKRGFAPHKDDILYTVKNIIKTESRTTPFKDGQPGRFWFKAFLKRNPRVSVRTPEIISKARAGVTEEDIRSWSRNFHF